MNILKAIIATILYVLVIELIGIWGLLEEYTFFKKLTGSYFFLIQGFLQFLVVLFFIHFFTKTPLKNLPQKTTLIWYLIAIVLGSSFIFLQYLLIYLISLFFDIEGNIIFDFDRLGNIADINIISLIILGPIAEELFFRQYLQKSLTDKYKPIFAILMASLLFALIHAPYLNLILESANETWKRSYIAFFGGLITGYSFYKSKSIGPPILMHISWNFMAIIV